MSVRVRVRMRVRAGVKVRARVKVRVGVRARVRGRGRNRRAHTCGTAAGCAGTRERDEPQHHEEEARFVHDHVAQDLLLTFFAPESHAKDCSAACVFALSKPGALHSPPR